MTSLLDYQTETLELLHDPNNTYYSVADINNYINRARIRIAARGQCCRFLASGGTITGISIVSGGSGYAGTATVRISGAGQQAAATATISGGAVNSITLVNGGWGYITGTTTTVTVTGSSGGSNATFSVTTDNSLTTIPGQEVYSFSLANTLLAAQTIFRGLLTAQGLISVAGAWGANAAMKPMLMQMIWSEFQAYYRSYNTGLQSYPTVFAKYTQGGNTNIYLWPLPSQYAQMDWDCWCLPITLTGNPVTDFEAIPPMYSSAVPYYAAHLAFFNAQRPDDARMMKEEYENKLLEAATEESSTGFVQNYYEADSGGMY